MTSTHAGPTPDDDAALTLARFVATTDLADIPGSTIDRVRDDLLDTIGCALAGADALGVVPAQDLVLDWSGAALASVWSRGRRVSPPEAAFCNAMAGHALDYDDQHPGVMHTGVSVVPAALATAETGHTSVDELLAAVALGAEVADRIAVATTDGPGVTGWLLSPLCGYFGAAAAAAKVLRLPEQLVNQALGFAYVQASGNGQSTLDGAVAKRMQPAFASRGGVFAAALAGRGLTAPTHALEGRRGYFHVYHRDRYDRRALVDGLGTRWTIDGAGFKAYPCCAWTHAALECALRLHRAGVRPDAIASIEVAVNSQAYESTGTPLPRRYAPGTVVDAQFSIPYAVAAALVGGAVGLADFTDAAIRRADVLRLAARVTAHPDDGLDAARGREISPARLVATLTTGERIEHTVQQAHGLGSAALSRAEVIAKFDDCCAYADVPIAVAERLKDVVYGSGRASAGELADLLRDPTASPVGATPSQRRSDVHR